MNYEELVKNHSGELIEKLVTHVVSQDPVEVLFNFEDNDQWAIVSMHQYEEDLEISLRMHSNQTIDLFVGYYDDEDEFHEIVHVLNETELEQLPDGLKKVMRKVVDDEKGMRLPGNFLSAK
ncbi:MAG TPA: hypothetical protein VJA82_09000 [Sediminibacterium sp.]|uniref:hypothetical protein n=1 Tax=Sediminibacterium sp. TaxID=1917865 RepID=UPI0008BC5CB5|nr:hypothetical protein [Sediminibacterium sp.]OHC84844.1 MAG: hypothetical protein A2472_14195 [Sphingobacteriia bacterium RIFOXYC2_FULL_35_18]OHC88919.1 MAG: hypothetical protein A2546_06290 [Sphingobacteriia bacterium RIFOXYD2_FULL_35_12]HLD53429.1 hypothetical protein [Sediminibacterium sp.]